MRDSPVNLTPRTKPPFNRPVSRIIDPDCETNGYETDEPRLLYRLGPDAGMSGLGTQMFSRRGRQTASPHEGALRARRKRPTEMNGPESASVRQESASEDIDVDRRQRRRSVLYSMDGMR